jgi:putative serine protease PepD
VLRIRDNGDMRINLRGLTVGMGLVCLACSVGPTGAPAATAAPARGSATIPVAPASPAPATGSFDPSRVAEVLGPAVGTIIVNTQTGTGEGSGFVVAAEGSVSYMLTNNHVIDAARKIQVLMPDGKHFTARVQGADPLQDIAVLRLDDGGLPRAVFGDSSKLRVGQPVVAIGSPLGHTGSVSAGIISALHRSIQAGSRNPSSTESETLPDVLQTDAPINPGNSGGPLADAGGQVIGVNTAASTNASGIGFAIPSLIAKRIAEALIAGRKPGHPYLGICYATEAQALAGGTNFSGFGAVISKALPGTPAEKAGLKGGDTIEMFDGIPLNNGQTLGGVMQLHNPGDTVKVTVARGTGTTDLTVTLGDRPDTPTGQC